MKLKLPGPSVDVEGVGLVLHLLQQVGSLVERFFGVVARVSLLIVYSRLGAVLEQFEEL